MNVNVNRWDIIRTHNKHEWQSVDTIIDQSPP